MTENSGQPGGKAAGVVAWMIREGRHMTNMRDFGDQMCRRVLAAGIPIWRGFCSVSTLHPQIYASAYVWRRGEPGAVRFTATHDFERSQEYLTSPIAEIKRTGKLIRRRLCEADCSIDYPSLVQFRAEGGTDYAAMPMRCSSGEMNTITWLTDHPDGFSAADLEGLTEVADALAIIVELQSTRRVAQYLLDTYVGHRTGKRVLSGAIRRGSGEEIRAIIWCCDLRGFTSLADRLDRATLIAMLNEFFEIMAGAVEAEGGETLKFIGDGMLAIFELRSNDDLGARSASALRAARIAAKKIADRNLERRAKAQPEIQFGLALHLGEVSYGNIGAPNRLDFTVIGPAVNHAARLENLSSRLGRQVVVSASFAAIARERLESLGRHELRGVAEPQEIFAPALYE